MATPSLMELIAKKKQDINAGKRQKTVKPPENRSRWRILPTWRKEGEQFWHDFGQHFIKDGKGDLKAVYVCVDKTYGRPCQVCDAIGAGIRASSDDDMVKMLKEANAAARILVNALHIDGDNPNEPVILELGPMAFNEILNIVTEWGADVVSLDKGMDMVIERTGKGMQTRYSVNVASKSQPVDAAVMKKIVNLDEYVAQESEEQARRALMNLSAASGMLPAPSATPAGKPSMAELTVEDVDATLSIPGAVPVEATPVAAATAVETVTATPAAAAAPAASAATGDAELDNLLAELG